MTKGMEEIMVKAANMENAVLTLDLFQHYLNHDYLIDRLIQYSAFSASTAM